MVSIYNSTVGEEDTYIREHTESHRRSMFVHINLDNSYNSSLEEVCPFLFPCTNKIIHVVLLCCMSLTFLICCCQLVIPCETGLCGVYILRFILFIFFSRRND